MSELAFEDTYSPNTPPHPLAAQLREFATRTKTPLDKREQTLIRYIALLPKGAKLRVDYSEAERPDAVLQTRLTIHWLVTESRNGRASFFNINADLGRVLCELTS